MGPTIAQNIRNSIRDLLNHDFRRFTAPFGLWGSPASRALGAVLPAAPPADPSALMLLLFSGTPGAVLPAPRVLGAELPAAPPTSSPVVASPTERSSGPPARDSRAAPASSRARQFTWTRARSTSMASMADSIRCLHGRHWSRQPCTLCSPA